MAMTLACEIPGRRLGQRSAAAGELVLALAMPPERSRGDLVALVQLCRAHGARAVWLHGSRAANDADRFSDIDLCIVVEGRAMARAIEGELHALGFRSEQIVDYLDGRSNTVWERDGIEHGLHFHTLEELERAVGKLYGSPRALENNQSFVAHTIARARALYDPNAVLQRLQARASSYPARLRGRVAGRALARLHDVERWWVYRPRWKGPFEELSDTQALVRQIALCHYALNGRLMMEGLKSYPADLRELRPNIRREVLALSRISTTRSEQMRKRAVLRRCIDALKQAHELQLLM